jgi:hypothetical protein
MKKSINDDRKSRGRPATGTAPLVGVRMTEKFQAEIKAWAKRQEDHPALATAIRRLVELGLKGESKMQLGPRPTGRLCRSRNAPVLPVLET